MLRTIINNTRILDQLVSIIFYNLFKEIYNFHNNPNRVSYTFQDFQLGVCVNNYIKKIAFASRIRENLPDYVILLQDNKNGVTNSYSEDIV